MEVDLELAGNYEVRCGDTGYFMGIEHSRFASEVYLRHESLELSANAERNKRYLCWCSAGSRPPSHEERSLIQKGWCPDILIWAVAWPEDWDLIVIPSLGNVKELIRNFFQLFSAIGYVDGQPRPRIVEVEFGENRFARDD